ncbi:MAG: hypothetical protein OH335_04980 [Candidatus Parvarchaeota archaeon]|nr:hypothetical protein [Candidatus Jingweiarchaeum tengchongense]
MPKTFDKDIRERLKNIEDHIKKEYLFSAIKKKGIGTRINRSFQKE